MNINIIYLLLAVLFVHCHCHLNRSLNDVTSDHEYNNHEENLVDIEQNLEEQQFKSFIEKFGKKYKPNEKLRRFKIFSANLKKIRELNKSERGTAEYGITHFTDYTENEFRKYATGLRYHPKKRTSHSHRNRHYLNAINGEIDLPESFDWREKNVVTEVKNQGFCGSCWAFSAIGNIEGVNAVKNGELVSLSEQELVDCDSLDEGCGGGFMVNAYKSAIKMGGLETESDYPYDARTEHCHVNSSLIRVRIDSYITLPQNETAIAQYLVQNGPISIGINAATMQFYMKGIAHPARWICNPKGLNHGVLIVGYGTGRGRFTKKVMPYWIIKNSWGKKWGESGYYRIFRGDGSCGVDREASSAIIN